MPQTRSQWKWPFVFLIAFALVSGSSVAQQRNPAVDDTDQPIKTQASNPDAVALVIGISDYQDSAIPKVEFAVNDADAVHRVLTQTMGYTEGRILSSSNAQASLARMKTSIRQGLASLVRAGRSDVFVYYSGHGAPNPATKEGYLIPWDFDSNYPPVSDSAYALKDLYADLGKLGARSVTVVLESCFSGANDSGKNLIKDASPLSIEITNPALTLSNGLVITASGGNEIATWDRAHSHGLMTYYWLRAMHGEAEDAQGNVSAAGLKQYLSDNVPSMARQLKARTQTPEVLTATLDRSLAKLPISSVRTGAATVGVAFGSLSIVAVEGGDLYVDGVRQETLPAGGTFTQKQIQVGPHAIEMRKDGYEISTRNVTIVPDKPSSITIQLAAILPNTPQVQQAFGLIAVVVDRGGTLYIDGKKIPEDLQPYATYTTARIAAGPHQVRVERAGFVTVDQEAMVQPNQTASLNLTLRAVPASPAAAPAAIAAARPADRPTPTAANKTGMEFVKIQPGTFTMGCSVGDSQCDDDEKPVHQVRITKSFEMGKYEVTQAQWQGVMGTNPSQFKGDALPVEQVTWNDTQEFLNKMNALKDGYRYRLPTEAEWEYAARAGTTGATPGTLDAIGWYGNNSGNTTHPVGQKQANAWGLYDMIGNVEEWVQDWYGSYSGSSAADSTGAASGPFRVLRGGSWYFNGRSARVSVRLDFVPTVRVNYVGFRVAREVIP